MRVIYFSLGWIFFLLGAVGVFLPVLPTTPFMILALWAFSRSSVRFHNWLYHHPFFGPLLQKWDKYRVIPMPAKILSVSFMAMSFLYVSLFSPMHVLLKLSVAILMIYGTWFVLTKPSHIPKQANSNEK